MHKSMCPLTKPIWIMHLKYYGDLENQVHKSCDCKPIYTDNCSFGNFL